MGSTIARKLRRFIKLTSPTWFAGASGDMSWVHSVTSKLAIMVRHGMFLHGMFLAKAIQSD
jgi:hypothetical protein